MLSKPTWVLGKTADCGGGDGKALAVAIVDAKIHESEILSVKSQWSGIRRQGLSVLR